jgi:hypothetical protein
MQGESYRDLLEDIRDHGVVEPIVLDDDGLIVDGRNRRNACEELGIGCPVVTFSSLGHQMSVSKYIWSTNVIRRHLTADQRAVLVIGWEDKIRSEASQRSRAKLKKGASVPELVKTPSRETATTRSKLAAMADVTENKIRDLQVIKASNPEVLPKIQHGELKVRDGKRKPAAIVVKQVEHEYVLQAAAAVNISPALVYLAAAVKEVDLEVFQQVGAGVITLTAAVKLVMSKFEELEKRAGPNASSRKESSGQGQPYAGSRSAELRANHERVSAQKSPPPGEATLFPAKQRVDPEEGALLK